MEKVEQQVQQWLEQVVIGLNLCPFAARPQRNGQVRIQVTAAKTEEALLADLQSELQRLDSTPAATLETSLLVLPEMLQDFLNYNQFLDFADALLVEGGWEGIYQVASFHPDYCFGGVDPDDPENLTNRSPYPILHLIREASLEQAINHYPDPELIPERNIARMGALSMAEKRQLFPYLFSSSR